jgi:hypothetical protein
MSGGSVYALALDTTGVFGNNLLALTTGGELWQITAAGVSTRLFSHLPVGNTLDGSMLVVPNNSSQYGPLAGKVVAVSDQTAAFAVDSLGNVTYPFGQTGQVGLNDAEGLAIVPASANFYAIADGSPNIYVAPGSQFTPIIGQIVVAHENPGSLERVWYDGTQLQHQTLTFNIPTNLNWEQVAFAPAPLEPGLPKWTIYLDLDNDGILNNNEPFQVTDLGGNYGFTNLAPGTYYVREVQNTGWTQTAPTPVPPGKYTVTLASARASPAWISATTRRPPIRPPTSPAPPSPPPPSARFIATTPRPAMPTATP